MRPPVGRKLSAKSHPMGRLGIVLVVALIICSWPGAAGANDDATPVVQPIETASATATSTPVEATFTPTNVPADQATVPSQPVATDTPEVPVVQPNLNCSTSSPLTVLPDGEAAISCTVTVSDGWVALVVPSGWRVRIGDTLYPSGTVQIGPLRAIDGETATNLNFSVKAPLSVDLNGTLGIDLYVGDSGQNVADHAAIALNTILPTGWELTCTTAAESVTVNASVRIDCSIPNDVWALSERSWSAQFTLGDHSVTTIPDSASFSLNLVPACGDLGDSTVAVDLKLGEAVVISATVPILVTDPGLGATPHISLDFAGFGASKWLGTSYQPVSAPATITVTVPDNTCADIPWTITATSSALSTSDSSFDTTVSYSTEPSSVSVVLPGNGSGTLTSGQTMPIASGTGSAEIHLNLTMTMPATAPSGTYSWTITFGLDSAP